MNPSESRYSWHRLSDKVESLPSWVLLAVAAGLYIPLAFLGFGSDSDAFSVVRTGQHFVETLDYVPSRLPGFFVHEVFVYFLNLVGGSLLSNLGTVAMALITLNSFRRICQYFQVPHATLLTAILMVQPFFWVNATSTIDYLWALGFCLLGFDLLLNRKYLPGIITLCACHRLPPLNRPAGRVVFYISIFYAQRRSPPADPRSHWNSGYRVHSLPAPHRLPGVGHEPLAGVEHR